MALTLLTIAKCGSGQDIGKMISGADTTALRKVTTRQDKYFSTRWQLEKAVIEEISDFKKGFVLTWKDKIKSVVYLRSFVFDLNSKFVTAYEQRFTNDTLLSQGGIELKNNRILYIEQVIIDKKSLKRDGVYWEYKVEGYSYEIFKDGLLTCIYHTEHLNHYEMLFEKANRNNIRLVFGSDCLGIKGN